MPRLQPQATRALALVTTCIVAAAILPASQDGAGGAQSAPTLEETRMTMGKWIETQQIISKERKEWQQGKEVLVGRLELLRQEIAGLREQTQTAETGLAEADAKRDALLAEKSVLEAAGNLLAERVSALEGEVRRLFPQLPEPIQQKLQPLYQRIPEDPTQAKTSAAERFQNVLGILNELNAANNQIAVSYEVRNLADGKPSEVQAIYVGLAQGYYVSAGGEAGIGRPSAEGWHWEPSQALAENLLVTLEILQGKRSPSFVPLPVTLQ